MRVAVTGGSGFIGGYVVAALHSAGHTVRCLLRPTSNTARIAAIPFERVEGDVTDASAVKELVKGCDACIHLALSAGWDQMRTKKQIEKMLETSQRGTQNVLQACIEGRVKVVFFSSAAAVNCSRSPLTTFTEDSPAEALADQFAYCRIKRTAEATVQGFVKRGLDATILCPAEVYGPNDTSLVTAGNLKTMITDWPVIIPSTGGTCVCHVEDVAAAAVAAITKGRSGHRYILGGEKMSVRKLTEATLALAGPDQRKKPILALPSWLLVGLIRVLSFLHLPSPVEPGVLFMAVMYFDSSKAVRELGYRVRTGEQVLAPVVAWLREAGYTK